MKFLIIFLIIVYAVYKLSGFFMRMLFQSIGNSSRQQGFGGYTQQGGARQTTGSQARKPMDGNVNIDFVPENGKKEEGKSAAKFKGGEYVDYEEIRDK